MEKSGREAFRNTEPISLNGLDDVRMLIIPQPKSSFGTGEVFIRMRDSALSVLSDRSDLEIRRGRRCLNDFIR